MDRREALRLMTTAAWGAPLAARGFRASARLGAIGVQLYTVRSEMERSVEDTLARIAQIGFREVEVWHHYGRTPRQIRALLDANHLTAPSCHVGLEAVEGSGADETIAMAHAIGHHYVTVASVDDSLVGTLDGWRRVADRFNAAGRRLRREGLQLAYHNHDVEFRAMEGRLPFDVLCENTDPHLLQIELDLYWITAGGGDPLAFFRRWPGRVPMVHVKDRTAAGQMVDVGAGAIDWRAIFAQRRQAGIRHYFVEHDEPADPFASIQASYEYLSKLNV